MDTSIALNSVTTSAVVVAAINYVKLKFPAISAMRLNVARWASILGAAIGAVGVNAAATHGANPGDWTITITGLTAATIFAAAWAWTKHFALQEIIYQSTAKKNGNGTNGNAAAPPTIKAKDFQSNAGPTPLPGSNTK